MNDKTQRLSDLGAAVLGAERNAILIVEDEKLLAWDIEQILREHDFQDIMVSTSVRGARHKMDSSANRIALVILDLKLEDGDGAVLIDEFINRGIAVLVITGYSSFQNACVTVLYKPFATNALLQSVRSLLANCR